MNWKRIVLIIGAVNLGIALITGVILFLRSRDSSGFGILGSPSSGSSPTLNNGSNPNIEPFVPISETPKAQAWKPGDPPPPITVEGPDDSTLGGPPQE